MAVLAIFNILSANPMVTTLDPSWMRSAHPSVSVTGPAPPDDHEDLADRDRDAGREARQSTRLRKNMPTQSSRDRVRQAERATTPCRVGRLCGSPSINCNILQIDLS